MGRFRSLLFDLGFSLGTALFPALGGCGGTAEEERKKKGAGEEFFMVELEVQIEIESEGRTVSAGGRGIDVIHRRRELYA